MTMVVSEVVAGFLKSCEEERHLSKNTIAAYKQDANEFLKQYASKDIEDMSGERLVEYASYLSNTRRLAPATVKRRIACLKSLFGWLLRKRLVAVNPFTTVELRIRIPDRLPRCLASTDLKKLLLAAEKAPLLTKLSTLLLYTTGVRVSELTAIRLKDINRDEGKIKILGKGNRERQVFFPALELCSIINQYISLNAVEMASDVKLFTSSAGQDITADTIRAHVKLLSRQAGLERNVTPHVLRHTTATSLLEAGVDIRFVQKLLGHRSIATTQIYTHVSDAALKSAVDKANIIGVLQRASS